MPKIDSSDRPVFEMDGVAFMPVASPSLGSTENGVWRARLEPGKAGTPHHMTREEILVALAGEGVVRIDGKAETLRPGDAYAVPAFTEFRLECAGSTPFEAMVVLPVGGRGVIGAEPAFIPPWSL